MMFCIKSYGRLVQVHWWMFQRMERVYYFPQCHMEQLEASTNQELSLNKRMTMFSTLGDTCNMKEKVEYISLSLVIVSSHYLLLCQQKIEMEYCCLVGLMSFGVVLST
ncbi:uncharacterized protein LOC111366956 isoform X2 [Olea europaea var. sylvestris]|nr:uncharacterized protein LOC111366956 isoform X2 [Olea europaea var. sylvestris]